MPSNDGRGYVLRRLLRRAARFGRTLGLHKPFLCELFPVLEKQLGDVFPELTARRTEIIRALRGEEESFSTTLDRGLALFEEITDRLTAEGKTILPGGEAFKLYDTFGFPLDLTVLMAEEKGFTIDAPAFDRFMAEQRTRARAARKDHSGAENDLIAHFVEEGIHTTFTGYTSHSTGTELAAILSNGQRVDTVKEGDQAELLLAETPFYAEAGGQIADTGIITACDGAEFSVMDTQSPSQGIILHKGTVIKGSLSQGVAVIATVDEPRRLAIQRHHTATHLLNAALRKVLKTDSIKQAGSYVSDDRLRFDFTWFEALTPEQLSDIERTVTKFIVNNHPVSTYEIPLKDLAGTDIIAVFDEKYGDRVRVVDTEDVSRELCGGTHVERSGDIGPFRILMETSIAAGIRRIEAQVGIPACEHTLQEHAILADLAHHLSIPAAELPARIEHLVHHTHALEKELKAATEKNALAKGAALAEQFSSIAGIPVLIESVGKLAADPLRALIEDLRQQNPDTILLLAAITAGKIIFILNLGATAQARGLHAGKLIGAVAKVAGGGGGGKPDKAQAGGKHPEKLDEALATARALITDALA